MFLSYLNSPIGCIEVKADENHLISISQVQKQQEGNVENPITLLAKKQLQQYFNGERREFDLPLDIDKPGFSYEVLKALQTVKYNTTISYQQLAVLAGCPNGSRAVGNAIHKNPYLIVLPCHRIIKSDGSIGGFALGVEKKKILLDLEKKNGSR